MAWYRPIQRADGKWDYACTNGAGTFPLGYCHEYRQLTPDSGGMFPPSICAKENARMEPFRAKYHDGGHSTEEEAMNCHREHELDQMLNFSDGASCEEQRKCGICNTWTTGSANVNGDSFRYWYLCDAHRTREFVEKLWPKGKA